MFKAFMFFTAIFQTVLLGNISRENLSKISWEERFYLRVFFRDFVYENHLGYVFFDEKPMALATQILHAPKNCIYGKYETQLVIKGWHIWKKYEYLFPHPQFLIIEEIREENGLKLRDIFVINKNNLTHLLNKHSGVFKEKLGDHFSPDKFMKNIEEKNALRFFLHHDEELLGILLGYGLESPKKYCEKQEIHEDEHYQILEDRNKSKIAGIVFMGDASSLEAQSLLCKYKNDRMRLCQIYQSQKDVLEVTLSMLCRLDEKFSP